MKENQILTLQELEEKDFDGPFQLNQIDTCFRLNISLSLNFLETLHILFHVQSNDTTFSKLIKSLHQLTYLLNITISIEDTEDQNAFSLEQRVLVYSILICQATSLHDDVKKYYQIQVEQQFASIALSSQTVDESTKQPETLAQQATSQPQVTQTEAHSSQEAQQVTLSHNQPDKSVVSHGDHGTTATTQTSLQQPNQLSSQNLEGQMLITVEKDQNRYLKQAINLLEQIIESSNPNNALLSAMHYLDKPHKDLQNNIQPFDFSQVKEEIQYNDQPKQDLLQHLKALVPKKFCTIDFGQGYGKISKKTKFLQSPVAKTLLDGSLYLREDVLLGIKVNDSPNTSDEVKTATLFLVILHEMGHLKKLLYSSNFNYLHQSPEQNIKAESGYFLEQNIFNGIVATNLVSFMDEQAAKTILNLQNWQEENSAVLVKEIERLNNSAQTYSQNNSNGRKDLGCSQVDTASYESPRKDGKKSAQPWWLDDDFKGPLTDEQILDYAINEEIICDGRLRSHRQWSIEKYGYYSKYG